MSRKLFLILGGAILCALPILSTFAEPDGEKIARLSAPQTVKSAPLTY